VTEIALELFEALGEFGLLFGAVPFAVAKGPESMTFDEEGVEDFLVPSIGVKLGAGESSVHVVLLKQGPGFDNAAMEETTPANGGLGFDKFAECAGIIEELTRGWSSRVEVGLEAGDEDVDKFGIGVACFGMLAS
jgi:hypothetical protein